MAVSYGGFASRLGRSMLAVTLSLSVLGGCASTSGTEADSSQAPELQAVEDDQNETVEQVDPPTDEELDAILDAEKLEESDSSESESASEASAPTEEWTLPEEIVFEDEEGSGTGGESDDTTKSRPRPDLSNASDQRALNVFLSNFTETGIGLTNRKGYVFNRYNASTQEYAHLAFWHYYQNGGSVETGDWKLGNVRAKASKLDSVTDYLTDRVVKNWASLNNGDGWYRYKDGYVYTTMTNGIYLCGPAVALYVRDNGDGYLRVGFDGYYQSSSQTGYTVGDDRQYSMSESQLNRLLGVSGPNGHGAAVVDYWWANGKWNFRLVSLTVRIS